MKIINRENGAYILRNLVFGIIVGYTAVGAANSGVITDSWYFNPIGAGYPTAQKIYDYLDTNGSSFIQLNATSATKFNFVEHAAFAATSGDGNGSLFSLNYQGGNITGTIEAYGEGNFNGDFNYIGGTIKMYQNPQTQYASNAGMYGANIGTLIATFSIFDGDGTANSTGSRTGQTSILAKSVAGDLNSGYFYSDGGAKLTGQETFSFVFPTYGIALPTANMVYEIACQFSAFSGPGCGAGTYSNVPGNHYFASIAGGQMGLVAAESTAVSEPGSLALMGLALAGTYGLRRRKKSIVLEKGQDLAES